MKTRKPGNYESDDSYLNELLGSTHREAFRSHVEQATRNLSVTVHDALPKRRSQYRRTLLVALSGIGLASSVALWLLIMSPDSVQPNPSAADASLAPAALEANAAEGDSDDLIGDMVDDEIVDHLASSTPQPSLIVTNDDIERLLED